MSAKRFAVVAVVAALAVTAVWWGLSSGDQAPGLPSSAADDVSGGDDAYEGTLVEGYVIDRSTGVSLAGATVSMTCKEVDDGAPRTATTDTDGGFAIDGLPADAECHIDAKTDGYVAASGGDGQSSADVVLRDGIDVHGIELSLYRQAAVEGRVTVGGQGLGQCVFTVLYLEAPGHDEPYTVDVETVSAVDGSFRIGGLAPGRIQVLAEHNDHAMAESASFFLKAGETKKNLLINLAAGGAVGGTVSDASGQPLEGARIALYAANAGPKDRAMRTGSSAADGTFRFEGVAVGRLKVTAAVLGYRSDSTTTTVVAGDTASVNLTLRRRAGIGGVVLDDQGRPVAGASIYSSDPEARGRVAARSNGVGRFWVGWEPVIGSRLFASHSKYATSAPVTVKEGFEDVTLVLKAGGRLRARVLDPTGRPVAVYTATVWPEPGTKGRGQSLRSGDSSGIMEVSSLAPGTYTIRVTVAGFPPAVTRPVKVVAKELTDAGDIRLAGGGSVTGRVIDATTNKPVANARVYLSAARAAGYRGRAPTASTSANGEFVIRGLPPGRLSLRFMRQGYLTRIESAVEVAAGEPLDVGDIAMSRVTGDTAGRGRMQYQGVGAVLRRQADGLLVQRVFDGSPASEAGLVAGTNIQTINGTAVGDLDLRRAVEMIRGESGSEVTLQVVLPGKGSPETIRVVRGEVVTPKQKASPHRKKR